MRLSGQDPPFESRIERNLDAAEVERRFGAYFKRPLEDFDRDSRYVAKHRDELTAKYRDEWVAILDGKVMAHSASHEELLCRLDELDLRQKAIVEYLWITPVNLIL